MSKLLGEKAICEEGCNYAIARTAWLFGPNGRNFVDRMMELSKTNPVLKIVNDKFGSPTYTIDLARSVFENFIEKKSENGIYHVVNEGALSRYELIKKVFEIKNIKNELVSVSSSEFPSLATLPDYSVLQNNKIPKLRDNISALNAYLS
jgi:dTDP-4-dehydrorhamnose reductase